MCQKYFYKYNINVKDQPKAERTTAVAMHSNISRQCARQLNCARHLPPPLYYGLRVHHHALWTASQDSISNCDSPNALPAMYCRHYSSTILLASGPFSGCRIYPTHRAARMTQHSTQSKQKMILRPYTLQSPLPGSDRKACQGAPIKLRLAMHKALVMSTALAPVPPSLVASPHKQSPQGQHCIQRLVASL